MTITIEIETDNASFEDNPDELRDCLTKVLRKIVNGDDHGVIMDTNGNRVGKFETEE